MTSRAPSRSPGRARRWTSVPFPDRVSQRRNLLVAAAFEILGSEGWDALTVRAVIDRADLNVRYFYESFSSVEELAGSVFDQVIDEMGEAVMTALAATPDEPEARVRAAVGAVVDFIDADRRRGRILYSEGLGSAVLQQRRAAAGRGVVDFMEQYGADSYGRPPPGVMTGRVGASILVGGFSQLLVDWLSGRIGESKQELVEDATKMFLAVAEAVVSTASGRRDSSRRRLTT